MSEVSHLPRKRANGYTLTYTGKHAPILGGKQRTVHHTVQTGREAERQAALLPLAMESAPRRPLLSSQGVVRRHQYPASTSPSPHPPVQQKKKKEGVQIEGPHKLKADDDTRGTTARFIKVTQSQRLRGN